MTRYIYTLNDINIGETDNQATMKRGMLDLKRIAREDAVASGQYASVPELVAIEARPQFHEVERYQCGHITIALRVIE